QVADGDGHLVAHVLRGDVDLSIQVEGDDDDHRAAAGDRAPLLDALDRVDLLLELLGDLGLHLFGRGAGKLDAHVDRGQVDSWEAVDAQTEPARRADHHEGHDQHRGEHRTFYADLGELLHGLAGHADGLPAREVARTGHDVFAALEAVDDLDVFAEAAPRGHADLGGLPLADEHDPLDAREHDDGGGGNGHDRLADLRHDVDPREGAGPQEVPLVGHFGFH